MHQKHTLFLMKKQELKKWFKIAFVMSFLSRKLQKQDAYDINIGDYIYACSVHQWYRRRHFRVKRGNMI